jgi:hypothetical protein
MRLPRRCTPMRVRRCRCRTEAREGDDRDPHGADRSRRHDPDMGEAPRVGRATAADRGRAGERRSADSVRGQSRVEGRPSTRARRMLLVAGVPSLSRREVPRGRGEPGGVVVPLTAVLRVVVGSTSGCRHSDAESHRAKRGQSRNDAPGSAVLYPKLTTCHSASLLWSAAAHQPRNVGNSGAVVNDASRRAVQKGNTRRARRDAGDGIAPAGGSPFPRGADRSRTRRGDVSIGVLRV